MKKLLIYLFVPLMLMAIWMYLARDKGRPIESFEAFFKVFREQYALFGVKQIDWNQEYDFHAPRVDVSTTDEELYGIFQEVLEKLDDKHCYIYRFNEIYFSGFDLPPLNYVDLLAFDFRQPTHDFSLELIEQHYLLASEKSMPILSLLPPVGYRKVFTSGWTSDSIAYLHMTEMSNQLADVQKAIRTFTDKYKMAKGFIVDIRDNIGGYSLPARELAEWFAKEPHTYAVSRLRQPGDIYAFQEEEYWKLEPTVSEYADQPVVLLVNENTQSAAELFALMMRRVPTVKVMGTTTSGVFADTHIGTLPNGWEYRLSVRQTNDHNDKVLEDIGIVPDTIIINSPNDLMHQTDKVMEGAIAYINSIKQGDLGS